MKTVIILSLSLLILGTLPATSAKFNNAGLYRGIISRYCRAVAHDTQQRYTTIPSYISRNSIQIRRVRSLSHGWLRIYGAGTANGVLTQGHVDYNPRSKKVRCPQGYWTYNYFYDNPDPPPEPPPVQDPGQDPV